MPQKRIRDLRRRSKYRLTFKTLDSGVLGVTTSPVRKNKAGAFRPTGVIVSLLSAEAR